MTNQELHSALVKILNLMEEMRAKDIELDKRLKAMENAQRNFGG